MPPHRIDVEGHAPIRQRTRRIPPKLLSAAHAEVDRLLKEGYIEPSDSPWSSCPVIVPKKDNRIRFCIDFRQLNNCTKKLAYPLHNMDFLLDNLGNTRYLSKIDLTEAYLQIPLDSDSKELTAFSVPGKGLFQFTRMPFGLTNAPASFQRGMDTLFGPEWQPHVFVYLDDIIIATNSFDTHLYWLEKVIVVLNEANLKINREKSEFCCSEIRYLGYIVDQEGLRTDPEKVRPILEYPPPTNVKQLRRFLGIIGWYARFIKDLAKIRTPLNILLKKEVTWKWEEAQQRAFETLLLLLTQAPILARPDPSIPFCIQTDASNYALGAVLTQIIDGEEHPIAFGSRTLTKPESNYTTTEKECLAVIWAVDKFRGYIVGEEFTVITDHSSLRWLHNIKDPTGRLARWATALQAHNMKIIHRKGALHHVPDALSRAYENEFGIAAAEDIVVDKWYSRRLNEVEKYPERFPNWKIVNNVLYKHCANKLISPIMNDLDDWKVVVPQVDRERILFEFHNTPHSGHTGIEKTYRRISQSYFWHKLKRDVINYVSHCPECQIHKVRQQAPFGLMGERKLEGPWSSVAADVMGPFPPSRSQFRYIVVFQDLFTRYVEIRPLRQATAANIIKAFEELVIFRWGCPKYFLTDNGTEFLNKTITKRMEELGIVQTTIAPYHAQANPVERTNRTLKVMICIFVEKDHRSWDLHLQEFAFAINSSVHSSTLLSPCFLNFGKNPRQICPLRNPDIEYPSYNDLTIEMWSDRLQRLPAIYDLVKTHLTEANKKQAKYYNKNRSDVQFRVGDLVLRKNHVLSSAADNFAAKLAPKYAGPCRIVTVLSPVIYEVVDENSSRIHKIHISNLKPFVS